MASPKQKAKHQKIAAIYARFSSDNQKESSITDQIADCRALAEREGYKVPPNLIFVDSAVSGTSRKGRDGAADLIAAIREESFEVLLCESQSRLARDVEFYAFLSKRLRSHQIGFHSVHDGAVDLDGIMGPIRAAIDEQFSITLGKNIRRSFRGRAALGFRPSQLTYGYRPLPGGQPGEWEIDPDKAKVLLRIFKEYASGVGVRDIAKGLTRDKIPTPKKRGGNAWGHQAFLGGGDGGLISNKLYIGESVWNKQYYIKDHDNEDRLIRRWRPQSEWIVTSVPHLRIIPQKLWDAAQALRESRQPVKVSGDVAIKQTVIRNKSHLLSDLLRCGKCEEKMIVCSSSKGTRWVRCGRAQMKSTCDHTRRYSVNALKRLIVDNLGSDDPEFEARQKRAYNARFAKAAQADTSSERAALESQIKTLKIQQARISDLLVDGDLDVDEDALKKKLKAKEIEKAAVMERLRRLGTSNVVPLPTSYDAFRKNGRELGKRLLDEIDEPSDALRLAFRNYIDTIVVQPSVQGEPYTVDAYGRLSAGDIEHFPKTRSVEEIVAAEGIPAAAAATSKVTPYSRYSSEDKGVVPLGRWRAAA